MYQTAEALIPKLSDLTLVSIAILCIVSDKKYLLSAFFFAIPILIFNLFEDSFTSSMGYKYHLTDSAVSLFIVLILSKLTLTNLRIRLQTLALRTIYVNLLGWAAYEAYISHIFYDVACLLIYSLALISTFKFDGEAIGKSTVHCNGLEFYCNNNTGFIRMRSVKKEKAS